MNSLNSKILKKEIYKIVEDRIDYFMVFQDIAKCKKNIYKQLEQYKTEKWLQAEIIYFLQKKYSNKYNVIPEYSSKKFDTHNPWDIFIELIADNPENGIFLEMKCLVASKQGGDVDNVIIDINKLGATYINYKNYEKNYLVILPLISDRYAQRILSKVDIEIKKYPMSVFRKEIKYNKERGITFIWINVEGNGR
ncbi:MAG TPA: hypothetical protein PKM63_05885 [Panacibacter sp.]|nr:hypothetical protein [Panacibacter sp.]HNP43795.1 hypothetical protein [Panacibacter sp.]